MWATITRGGVNTYYYQYEILMAAVLLSGALRVHETRDKGLKLVFASHILFV